ncbi:peptidyl-prolyl cis-trans isomerase 6-like [Saccoglossus kowalevskii]|uniref:Peptidyl-prolyl cis-trans isomerase n=1 Tax=Saccoglossus kowalevskii TaxID=10224 RepID=A0ABM0GMJ5_SACKO|nr:PREDICTED: peptidyl-prolyl cis-trans isomerase B-like [Saccoglossus kowalevskii]
MGILRVLAIVCVVLLVVSYPVYGDDSLPSTESEIDANTEVKEDLTKLNVTDLVYLDVLINGLQAHRQKVVIGLFGDVVPKTVRNFVRLAANKKKGKTYKHTNIHKVKKGTGIFGGDVVYGNGTGVYSIFGKYFADENFKLEHYGAGWVSMVNHGKVKNGCQFLITTSETYWLNGKQVVFGKVLKGMERVQLVESILPDDLGRPTIHVEIANSGKLKMKKKLTVKLEPDDDVEGFITENTKDEL